MNGVQTRFKCKLDVKRCKRFVFPPSSLLPRSNALKTKAIRYFQTDRTLTRIVSPPLKRNAATPIQLEQITTEYEATFKKLEATRRQREAALSGVNEVSHRRENTEAAIQRATAALEMARLNLSYTVVLAPCDGKLGRRSLEEGQFITAGQCITYILPDTQKWIIANYKETQIENLRIGQEVAITVDAISKKEFTGKVTAISGATGSKYSLVPTDNSAGNFVKIQQRIPVRIDFTDLSKEDNDKLAAGMMVVVKAKL